MSFILDALRKSDAERQRAVTPGLSDVRYATRRSKRNIWLPILVAVLAANAVFLAVQRRDDLFAVAPLFEIVGAFVPDRYRTCTVLAGRNLALDLAVVDVGLEAQRSEEAPRRRIAGKVDPHLREIIA